MVGLSQEERRHIFESQSKHIAIGMSALPQISRRLHHCRDLEIEHPFDFITYFDFESGDEPLFNQLLEQLRATEEWLYVEREIDIRIRRVI